jgi:chromate transporter
VPSANDAGIGSPLIGHLERRKQAIATKDWRSPGKHLMIFPRLPVCSLKRLNGRMSNRSAPRPPSLAALFLSFLTIGSTSFGGGLLGWIRRELVERRAWIDDTQFLVYYGLSQMVPGATNVNLSVIIGSQLRGVAGALTAVAGLLLVPLVILLTLGAFYFATSDLPASHRINAALVGAGAAAIGFNIATGLRLGQRSLRRIGPLLVAAAIIVGIGVLGLPLLEVVVVMVPISLVVTLIERAA